MPEQEHPDEESKGLLAELARRRVFRVAGTYVLVAWVLMQAGEIVFPAFDLPNRALRLLILFLVAGFPVIVFLAWLFDVTPSGIRLTRPRVARSEGDSTDSRGRNLEILLLGLGLPLFAFASLLIVLTFQRVPETDVPTRGDSIGAASRQQSEDRTGLAVLPFEDLSRESEDGGAFARGMHEEILIELARVPDLRLISRHSVERDASPSRSPVEIGKALGVEWILEGSVRRVDDRVRVSAALIDVETGSHRWADRFDAEPTRILAVQSELARQISKALEIELDPGATAASTAESRTMRSLPALDAYLKARDLHRQAAASDERARYQAELLYEEALRLDGGLARAWLHLSILHAELYWFGFDRSSARAARVRGCLDQARELGIAADRLALGEGIAAYYVDRQYGRALLLFDEVTKSAPGDSDAHFYRAMVLRRGGALDLALEAQKRARSLDPLNLGYEDEYALTLSLSGRLEEARSTLRAILARNPDRESARIRLWQLDLELEGDPEALLDLVLLDEATAWSEARLPLVTDLSVLIDRPQIGDEFLTRFAPMQPDGGAHRERQATLLVARGKTDRAIESAGIARTQHDAARGADPMLAESIDFQQLGNWIAFREGKIAAAIAAQAALVEDNPIERDLIIGAPLLWDLMLMQLEAGDSVSAATALDRLATHVAPGSIPNGGFFFLDRWPLVENARSAARWQATLARQRPDYADAWSDKI